MVHINAEGVEDYKVDSNDKGGFYGGGGIRFNADFSLLATVLLTRLSQYSRFLRTTMALLF